MSEVLDQTLPIGGVQKNIAVQFQIDISGDGGFWSDLKTLRNGHGVSKIRARPKPYVENNVIAVLKRGISAWYSANTKRLSESLNQSLHL
jgi:hypothetical protein